VCGEREFADEKKDVLTNPMVIIEVLFPSTAAYDRGGKAPNSQIPQPLRQFLLVEQTQPRVDCYVRHDDHTWTLTTAHGLDASIDLPSIGCTLRPGDIYFSGEFPP